MLLRTVNAAGEVCLQTHASPCAYGQTSFVYFATASNEQCRMQRLCKFFITPDCGAASQSAVGVTAAPSQAHCSLLISNGQG